MADIANNNRYPIHMHMMNVDVNAHRTQQIEGNQTVYLKTTNTVLGVLFLFFCFCFLSVISLTLWSFNI